MSNGPLVFSSQLELILQLKRKIGDHLTQLHSLAPFGTDLFGKDMIEDNMTWNFIAGLTVAREILENYGCVIRVMSPRNTDAALGAGGTRVELWLPSFSASSSDGNGSAQEA